MDMQSERSDESTHKRGRPQIRWYSRTWIHKVTGEEYTVEAKNRKECEKLFKADVPEPREWREER